MWPHRKIEKNKNTSNVQEPCVQGIKLHIEMLVHSS
jgi:hypothetical protein